MLLSPFKAAFNNLKAEMKNLPPIHRTPRKVNRWFKWLSPGLLVKRWLFIGTSGVILTSLGLAIWFGLTPVYRLMEFISHFLEFITTIIPRYVSGPIIVILGLFFVFWGVNRIFNSITEVFKPENDQELVDVLLAHRRLNRGPRIVAIGGGTGLSTLLRGLKEYSANITAIVTVADDGGSSGRLRREIGVLPPGDIRNCIAALADEERLLTELFQYRFQAGDGLSGHSFGNLFLTAMTDITGDLERGISASSKVLAIQGKVFPSTLEDVILWARLADGRIIEGESNITEAEGKIIDFGCYPPTPQALPAAIKAIEEADYIIIGPGSLYTSVIPNLLVPEIRQVIAKTKVPRIYICNIMTQPGETDGYTVADHIKAIDKVCKQKLFDAVLVHRQAPSEEFLTRYAKGNSHPVFLDREDVIQLGRKIILANVVEQVPDKGYVRHNPYKLARVLFRWYSGKWQPKIFS